MVRKALVMALIVGVGVSVSLCLAQADNTSRPRGPRGVRGGFRPGMAQTPQSILESFDRTAESLPTTLNLTPAQADRFKYLAREHRRALEQIVKQLERETEQYERQLGNILTSEQQAKYQEMKRRPQMPGGRGFSGIWDEMNLSPEKKAQVEKVMSDWREKMQSTRGDRQARQAALQEMQTQLQQILTPEEYQKFQERMPMFGRGPRGGAR